MRKQPQASFHASLSSLFLFWPPTSVNAGHTYGTDSCLSDPGQPMSERCHSSSLISPRSCSYSLKSPGSSRLPKIDFDFCSRPSTPDRCQWACPLGYCTWAPGVEISLWSALHSSRNRWCYYLWPFCRLFSSSSSLQAYHRPIFSAYQRRIVWVWRLTPNSFDWLGQ